MFEAFLCLLQSEQQICDDELAALPVRAQFVDGRELLGLEG